MKRFATATSAEDLGERTEYIYDGLSYAFLAGLSPAATDFAQANGIGRVVAIRSGSSVVELFAYTRGGQLQRKRTVAQGIALEVSYAYRTDGRLESVTYPSGRILKYGYGDWGKANSMQNPGGSEYQHATFDWNERLTAVAGETWQYTATGQLYRWQGSRDLTYNYDWPGGHKNGKLYQQVDNGTGKVTTYGYDLLGRLSSASSTAGWTQTYDFDGFGNLWRATGSGGAPSWDLSAVVNSAKNRVVEGGSFDDAGNHVWNLSVTYDYENRMRTAPSGTAFVSSSYDYSADNKRVIKRKAAGTSNEEWEVTLWANGQRMAVRNYGPGNWKLTEYSYFAGRRFSWDATNLNASMANSSANYIVPAVESADQLGSAVEHLPFGDQIVATGGSSQKFTGYWRDGETGLDYADQRYYQPGRGRFMSADPYQASAGASNPGTWNRYAYVQGDTVNHYDPRGMQQENPGVEEQSPYDSTCIIDGNAYPGWVCSIFLPRDPKPRKSSENPASALYPGFNLAVSSLRNPDCWGLIGGGRPLDPTYRESLVLNNAIVVESSLQNVTWDGNNWSYKAANTIGFTIEVNSEYFKDPAARIITAPDGKAVSILDLESASYGRDLDAQNYQALTFLHEFSHMLGRRQNDEFDPAKTHDFNEQILSTCLK